MIGLKAAARITRSIKGSRGLKIRVYNELHTRLRFAQLHFVDSLPEDVRDYLPVVNDFSPSRVYSTIKTILPFALFNFLQCKLNSTSDRWFYGDLIIECMLCLWEKIQGVFYDSSLRILYIFLCGDLQVTSIRGVPWELGKLVGYESMFKE